jgi:hypothetical protein
LYASGSGSKKAGRLPRGPTKKINQVWILESVKEDGEPEGPKDAVTKMINFLGALVRDSVPLNVADWRQYPGAQKDLLWNEVKARFTLPLGVDEDKVKEWALRKMAEQHRNHRKRLHNQYVKKGTTPDFQKFPKLRHGWVDFLQYKLSEDAQAQSISGKENASKKEYHHKLGPGGYKGKEKKWHKWKRTWLQKG